jgi:4-alpha-glucanotransferase
MTTRRGSGILLHITSLPSLYGIGDFGPGAYRFVDWLGKAGQSFWQILPLNPTDSRYDNSPYHSVSSLAFNPLMVSPELLVKEGLLKKRDLNPYYIKPHHYVDFQQVIQSKTGLLYKAYDNYQKQDRDSLYDRFYEENRHWLDEYALFISLKNRSEGKSWSTWPVELRDRHPDALNQSRRELRDSIQRECFIQYLCAKQWAALKSYCKQKGIQVIGDIPIYVEYDGVDVWTRPELFKLDENKNPSVVAGVPPDYFSETGQLWGNPVYNWGVMRSNGYDWWMRRIEHNLSLFDIVRIDHFRGLVAFWEVPAGHDTAIHGQWIEAPADDFFHQLLRHFPALPIIAEDLGMITPEVREVMSRYALPGMKVLEFAFDNDPLHNPHIPHNLPRRSVVYTGTHDNNTIRGWFEHEISTEHRERVLRYLGSKIPITSIHWACIQLAMMSVADIALFPMQDVLGLGGEHRMNRPGTSDGNWRWRLLPNQLKPVLADKLARLTRIYARE